MNHLHQSSKVEYSCCEKKERTIIKSFFCRGEMVAIFLIFNASLRLFVFGEREESSKRRNSQLKIEIAQNIYATRK